VSYREKEQVLDETKSLPNWFSTLDAVLHRHVQRIAKYLAGFLNAHAVLAPVGEVLGLVPLKPNTFPAIIAIINL
jgi:hypothetical protein